MQRSPEQNKRFHTLIGLLRIDSETKRALVYEASNGLQTSSKCLSFFEMKQLIDKLQDIYNKFSAEQHEACRKMRRKIFAIFHDLEWEKENGRLDYHRINEWLLKSSYLHKPINDYKEQELPELVSQVETMQVKSYSHAKG